MKNPCFLILCLLVNYASFAQDWVAPEGKVINHRTLIWTDFHGKPSREAKAKNIGALTHGALYFTASGGSVAEDGKMHFDFKVQCAFQSASWVRKEVKSGGGFSDQILNHEQGHYDISLIFADQLQKALGGRGYSKQRYKEEIDSVYLPIKAQMERVQDDYDSTTNHGLVNEIQHLWDCRIRKCMENCTDQYLDSALKAVAMVAWPGQWVKKMPNEPFLQFAVRCRPIYTQSTDSLNRWIKKFSNWSGGMTAAVSFYEHNITFVDADKNTNPGKELIGYAYLPLNQQLYRRVLLDTFSFFGVAPQIKAVFFANADKDTAKEMVVLCSVPVKNKAMEGTVYITTIFDDEKPGIPSSRLRRLSDISMRMTGGVEGTMNGKPSKARYKTEMEIREGLKAEGFTD